MRENEPVLLVLSAYDGKLFLRKGNFYLKNVRIQLEVCRLTNMSLAANLAGQNVSRVACKAM